MLYHLIARVYAVIDGLSVVVRNIFEIQRWLFNRVMIVEIEQVDFVGGAFRLNMYSSWVTMWWKAHPEMLRIDGRHLPQIEGSILLKVLFLLREPLVRL
jgi:hypothetical protein